MKPDKKNEFCTIYKLTNTVNNKIYIGQSWYPLKTRMGKNGENYKNSPYLYNAIQKYGVDKFEYEILKNALIKRVQIQQKNFLLLNMTREIQK